jgi:hypothetical protein
LAGHGFVTVQGRAVLDLFIRQFNRDGFIFFVDSDKRIRLDQHLPACEPSSRFGDQITDGPVPIIKIEFLNFADFSIHIVQFLTFQGFDFA